MNNEPVHRAAPQQFHRAAVRAQELVLAAQAIEARVSALSVGVPPAVVRETVSLIKACAGQLVLMVLDLVAHGERIACELADSSEPPSVENKSRERA